VAHTYYKEIDLITSGLNDLKETILKLMPKQSNRMRNDLLFMIIIVGAVLLAEAFFDVDDKLVYWLVKENEIVDFDVIIFLFFVLVLAFAVFSWRRWRELIAEIKIRKQVEEALKKSEEKYKILTESSQTGIYIHQDEIIVYANDRFAELYGYTVDELIGTNYFNLFSPDERARAQEIKSKRLRGEDAPQQYEIQRVKKDGGILWGQTVAVCILYQGKPAIMGNIVDISERKQTEEQRDRLIADLQKALSEVKTLRGFLPICSHCKKIRDDKGYWNQIESYIRDRSDAEFSHGICPECTKKYYPDFNLYDEWWKVIIRIFQQAGIQQYPILERQTFWKTHQYH